jgi:hypothetical protein
MKDKRVEVMDNIAHCPFLEKNEEYARGIEAAMLAHFAADFVLYVVSPMWLRK